jgi:hypothetical protein
LHKAFLACYKFSRAEHSAHKKHINLEDVMKKVLSLLAMALMIVGLSGCMDNPDASKQKVSSSTSSVQL